MHTIRLAGGWSTATPRPGETHHVRRFGRPRTLAPNETVRIAVPYCPGAGSLLVNGRDVHTVAAAGPLVSDDIRSVLRERNELTLILPGSTASPPTDVEMRIAEEPLALTPATADDYPFTHDLTRSNMERYVARYWGGWDPAIYRTNYDRTENLVLRLGPERVGFVRLEPADGTLVLEDVQLLPAYQNRGLGRWTLDRVADLARDRGGRTVRLRCFKDNPARRLYERAGFRVVEDAGIAEWWERPVGPETDQP